MINPIIKRGSAELAILSILAASPLHGYEIARRIESETDGKLRFTLASLYPMLYRLEARRHIQGAWRIGENGRRRRYYRLTPGGKKRLGPLRKEWQLFVGAIEKLSGTAGG